MIKIERFVSFEKAFDKTMEKDIDYVLIHHSYAQGTHIVPHSHDEYDEFVIVSVGHFKISSEGEEKEFDLNGEDVVVIYYPAGKKHSLKVLGKKLDYFVLRKKFNNNLF